MDLNPQAAFRPVKGGYAATVEAYRSFGDCQAQSDSAGLPAAIVIKTIKRLEEFLQRVGRNSGAAVRDADYRLCAGSGIGSFQMNLDRTAFTRVTNGIAYDVFDSAVQERGFSTHRPASFRNAAPHVAMPRLGFEFGIFRHIEYDVV